MLKSKHVLIVAALGLAVATPLLAQDPKRGTPSAPHGVEHAAPDAHGIGVVKAIDPAAGAVTISHEPIAELSWPAMTMAFKVAQPDLLKGVTVGNKVQFALQGKTMAAVIVSLKLVE